MVKERTAMVLSTDTALCRELESLLANAGLHTEIHSPGPSPLREIRKRSPDLALLDITVDATGLDLVRRLEGGRAWGETPLIIICEQPELEYELLDIFDFLAKPLDRSRLKADLDQLSKGASDSVGNSYPCGDEKILETFQDEIYRHSGLHFDQRNRKILDRGLMRRMQAVRARSHRDYLDYLRRHAQSRGELKKLLALLTVGETYFFRYLPQFEAMKTSVLPELIRRNRQQRSMRLWSAGCSTGEEPYSLAILLREHFPHLKGWDIDIIGTDINPRSLKTAREGRYKARSLRVMDPAMIDRYFTAEGDGYRICDAIRNRVRFTHLNLQTDPYPEPAKGTADVDVIFCRNVMIYFRTPTIMAILEGFHRCLNPRGYLFLGHAESLSTITTAFSRVPCDGGFFYQRLEDAPSADPAPPPSSTEHEISADPCPEPPPSPPEPPVPVKETEMPPAPGGEDVYQAAEKAFQQEDFKTAKQKYDIVLRQNPSHVGALLGKGFVHANRGKYDRALQYCRKALESDDLAVGAYFLLGLIRELRGEAERAMHEYRKAVMLDIDFVMAHYNLGKTYRRLGRDRDARRELDNTARILENLPDESLIPFSGGLSREVFLEICREDRETIRG